MQRRLRRLLHPTLHPTLCGGAVPPSAERIASELVRGKISMLLCSGHTRKARQADRDCTTTDPRLATNQHKVTSDLIGQWCVTQTDVDTKGRALVEVTTVPHDAYLKWNK